MAVKDQPQESFVDLMLENEHLVGLLEEWSDAKASLAPYREAFQTADEKVKAEIKELGLEPGDYRCGRFVVAISDREPKEVSFERKSGVSIRIKQPKADD